MTVFRQYSLEELSLRGDNTEDYIVLWHRVWLLINRLLYIQQRTSQKDVRCKTIEVEV